MSKAAANLQYTAPPDRAARLLAAEDDKDKILAERVAEFRWVGAREPNADRDVEDVHGVPVTHHFVDAPGESETLRWHYVEAGAGEPVVLLHGIPESWYGWNYQIADLARTHRVIAVDLKGYGQSDKGTGDYRHEGVSEQMLAMFDEIGLGSFNLVAHDRGSVQADYLIANHLDRVLRYARGEQHLFHFHPDLAPQQRTFSHPDINGVMRDPHLQVLRSYTRLTALPVPDEHIVRTIQEWSWPDIWWAVPRYFNSSSFRKEWIDRRTRLLDAWTCPVTILQGGLDPRQPYEFYERAAEYIPNAPSVQVRIIDAGHFFQAEAPEQIARTGSPVEMLRSNDSAVYPFPIPREFTNWRDEQESWRATAVLFNQSHHMTDIYFKGPGLHRLLSDFGVNNFATFGRNKGKQFVAVNEDGAFIGDAILFGLEDDEYSLVGTPVLSNWIAYNAQAGGYDVEVRRDERSKTILQPGRLTYRYQLQGPQALKIVEKASGGTLQRIKFFNIGEFTVAGTPVRALNHTMTGIPGEEFTGLELWGPAENGPRVLDALIAAGEEFGLRQGGALAYSTVGLESGWIAQPVPALYTSPSLKPYREYLSADGFEAASTLGGSFYSPDIEDYYLTPWDFGYGRLIHWEHDFLGRDALRRRADEPHRVKVLLAWNSDDVGRALLSTLFADDSQRARYFELPSMAYSTFQYDRVLVNDVVAGISTRGGYNTNRRSFFSLAMVDRHIAHEGAEVVVTWGEANGGVAKPYLERHVPVAIRATASRLF